MKQHMSFLILCLFLISIQPIQAFDGENMMGDTVIMTKKNGNKMVVQSLITGEVSLLRQSYLKRDLSDIEIIKPELYGIEHRYFISGEQTEEITHDNYRRLIKKYLKDAPQLHRRLGRLGFRFENIPSMILYYNRFKSEELVTVEPDFEITLPFLMD